MKNQGIKFDPGLTDAEVEKVEKRFGFQFPVDLKAFLQLALPVGEKFPNWRSSENEKLIKWLDQPRQGVEFDVLHNNFWLDEWGPRPKTLEEVEKIINKLLKSAPILIPIYAHRMMSCEPNISGNPVFSVHQTDIIHYGFDLLDYLKHEFKVLVREPYPERVREIRFWNIERFQEVRWGDDGSCEYDNSGGMLPESIEQRESIKENQQDSSDENNHQEKHCHTLKKENVKMNLDPASLERIKNIASIDEKIIAIIRLKYPFKKKSEINLATILINDLEMDSLDLAELIMELEDVFKINADDYEPKNILRISDIIKYVKSKTKNGNNQKYQWLSAIFLILGSLFAFSALNTSQNSEIAEKIGAYLPCTICWVLGLYFFFKGKGIFF